VERPASAGVDVGERVKEEDDVGVALGMLLVHPQLAAACGRPPVDAPRAVALCARDLVPDEHLRLERRQQRVQRLDARVDAQRLASADAPFPGVEAEAVVRADERRAEDERPPADTAERQLERARVGRGEREGAWIVYV